MTRQELQSLQYTYRLAEALYGPASQQAQEAGVSYHKKMRAYVKLRAQQNRARRDQDAAYRDLGLVKVRGALGGVYWE